MLKALTRDVSNKRFLTYTALLYILAMTAGTWVPASSPIFDSASYIKLPLIPLAQAFLLMGVRHRWPEQYKLILLVSSAFFGGVIASTFFNGFF